MGVTKPSAERPTRLTRTTLADAVTTLTARDRGLARIVGAHGPPPLWARPSGFATLFRIILEQQVSLASAATLSRRLERQVPGGITPATVLDVGPAGFRALGLTRQKSAYVCALAEHVHDGRLDLRALARAPDADVISRLSSVPGIGPWSAGIYLLMALRRPDVWPPGDLALHKAIGSMRRAPRPPTSEEAARLARRWAPYRAVAARILWQGYLAERNGASTRTVARRYDP